MSNPRVINFFGVKDPYLGFPFVNEEVCDAEAFKDLKTYFTKYRNPIGIEVEVEAFNKKLVPVMTFWECKNDGSLKIAGVEFVSVPLSGRQIDCAIKELSHIFDQKQDVLWSHRTSIHVHVNVTTLTMNQLHAFLMLYGLFEDLYFSMAKPERKANPYCYPVRSISAYEYTCVKPDSKYCALNLAPIKQFGTVEFRHLHGSADWRLLRRWIQLIVKLHYCVDEMNPDTCINDVLKIIQEESFEGTFKAIYGATSVLFDGDEILKAARLGAPWSVSLADEPFVK
jgi:hypothetical protein